MKIHSHLKTSVVWVIIFLFILCLLYRLLYFLKSKSLIILTYSKMVKILKNKFLKEKSVCHMDLGFSHVF